jgi:hemoglobin/transferrin/lactoferrin receptor protein
MWTAEYRQRMQIRRVCSLLILLVFSLSTVAFAADTLTGTVKDAQGKAVAGASVSILTGDRAAVAAATTDAQGKFSVPGLAAGSYLVVVKQGAFSEARVAATVTAGKGGAVDITLQIAAITDQATVTASRDAVGTIGSTGQPVNVITGEEIANRAHVVAAQAVEGEVGVSLQRTSPTMAGIFIRGLLGNKVNVFVDGVRYSNGAQRGGVNTFLNLIDQGGLDSIEILRGPSSDQYGSDALGGTVTFLSKSPALLGAGGKRVGGQLGASGGTAHRNGGGNLFLSYMAPTVGLSGSVSGRNVGLLRPGGGIDSHAAVTRFLGVSSDRLMDERLPNTSFTQMSESVRMNWVANANTSVVASYLRSDQDGGDRYDSLLGGDGNLISELNDLSLDLFSVRLERVKAGPLQNITLNYALNSQREERVNQGGQGSSTAAIGHEPERTTIHSVTASAGRQLSDRASFKVGGDMHFEKLTSDSFNITPATGASSLRRPRVPSGATFNQGGAFASLTFDAMPDKVRLVGSVRLGRASYKAKASDAPLQSNNTPLWPDDSLTTTGVGFRAAAIFTPKAGWMLSGLVSRGFRAPHMTDLGTLGLTGSGFEVAAADLIAAGLSGTVGTTADAAAISRGDAVAHVGPETSLNFEGTVAYTHARFRTDVTVFRTNIHDNIQKVALILPSGATGKSLAGNTITSQNANGAVFVAASTVPVLVRANFDNARMWGFEHSLSADFGRGLLARTAYTYITSEDTATGMAPNIEGGIPHPHFDATVRWSHASGRVYVEPYLQAASKQTHLSTLDAGDRRTGSGRSASQIRNFFNNGARNRSWISNGPDGIAGNTDDILTITGETANQIVTRILGTASSNSMFAAIPGWVAYGTRIGLRYKMHEVVIDFENIGDKNYRGMSWGMDAPGRGISVRYGVKF